MKKILVTGFDPFGGEKVNPALEVIKLLPKKIGENEVRILEIPTVYKKSLEKIEKEIENYSPDYILSIGQAGGRANISINNIPSSISNTAGTFVCNHVFYGVRYLIEKKFKGIKSGFVHIPYMPEQVIGKADTPSMSLDNILKGVIVIIETIFNVENDIKKSGGTIC